LRLERKLPAAKLTKGKIEMPKVKDGGSREIMQEVKVGKIEPGLKRISKRMWNARWRKTWSLEGECERCNGI
jgi:hypothetical protein